MLIRDRNEDLVNVWGFMDGFTCSFLCYTAEDMQNAYYNGWKHRGLVSCVYVWSPDGVIRFASYNFPGSFHDSMVSHDCYERLLDPSLHPDPYRVIGDAAFYTKGQLRNKIRTPLKLPQKQAAQVCVHLTWL